MGKHKLTAVLLVVTALLILLVLPAAAHEEREVGQFLIEFGWRSEPALTGQINGPELFVHLLNADGSEGDPVEDGDFQVTITFGDTSTTVGLVPAEDDPGHYVATIIPMLPGDYSFELTGNANGTAIDEIFTSADGYFDSVEPSSDLEFPSASGSSDDLLSQIQALRDEIDQLRAALDDLRSGTPSGG